MRENPSGVEPNWAAFAALDWGEGKHFYCVRAAGEQQRVEHSRGDRGLVAETGGTLWARADRHRRRAVARGFGAHALGEAEFGDLHRPALSVRPLSGDIPALWRQKRRQRHGNAAGDPRPASRPAPAPAAGHGCHSPAAGTV